ncbi:PAN domain-containing protein [Bradyrhizobium genosp. A]|uniref:PAN domain-containing protein n=1 Tax=Bradyrhizobium genosp. A TaxID=83626 RepID=UPI003CFAA5B4
METPDQEDKPAASPLDAERAKLRKAGYTDAEISQILIARAVGTPQQPAALAGQGVLSNVTSSLLAIGNYARGTLFSIRDDVAAIFDRTASAPVRAGATASLVVKVVVVAVLGFAAWQEWHQHIIFQTTIAESQATKTAAEAAVAKELNDAQTQKLREEAAVANKVNQAQAEKIRAEECTARMQAAFNAIPLPQLQDMAKNGIPEDNEKLMQLMRDCDPTFASRTVEAEAVCVKELKAILAPIDTFFTFTKLDDRIRQFSDSLRESMSSFKARCPVTNTIKTYTNLKLGEFDILVNKFNGEEPLGKDASPQRVYNVCVGTLKNVVFPNRSDLDEQIKRDCATIAVPSALTANPATTEAANPDPDGRLSTRGVTDSASPPAAERQAALPVRFRPYNNVDMYGGDIAVIRKIELSDCEAACRADSNCIAYSYDKWNKSCYPKSEFRELLLDARSITALKGDAPVPISSRNRVHFDRYRNKGFPKQPQQSRTAQSFEQCEAMCGLADWCAALTFYRSTHECQLLQTTDEYFSNLDAYSAAKSQAN